MKKLLNVLAVMVLVGSSATVVACGTKKSGNDNNEKPNTNELQKEMLQGAEFISRLIIGGRHENLNYNINEILSMFLTPSPSAMNMPISYKNGDKNINLGTNISRFKNYLAPSLTNYNSENYAGMFASYIMGMYDNDFYESMINTGEDGAYYFNDTFSTTGNQGYNKKNGNNAMGYAAGLGKDINLSDNEERRNLAWGIQDTGALSNYLLNLGFDGANPTDTNGTSSPKSSATEKVGTNGSGYAWYNSILMKGSATRSKDYSGIKIAQSKLKDQQFQAANADKKSKINGKEFNSTGGLITKVAGEQNINGYISLFGSMLDNISDTKNGALVLSEFMNTLFPMINTKKSGLGAIGNSNNVSQAVGLTMTSGVWKGIKNLEENSLITSEALKTKIKSLDKAPTYSFLGMDIPKLSSLYKDAKRDKDKRSTNAKDIVEIIDELIKVYQESSNKKEFNEQFFWGENAPFKEAYSKIMEYTGHDNWKETMIGQNDDGGINLLKLAQSFYKMLTEDKTISQFELIIETFKDSETFRDLSTSEKNKFLKLIGWTEKGYEEDSLAGRIYKGFTNEENTGQKDFKRFFAGFKDYVAKAMKEVHDPVLKYLVEDDYWKVNDFKINTTSNTQLGGKMEFTLDYKGIGDVTSTASEQTEKVTVGKKFNPYQTIAKNQEDKWTDNLKEKLDPEKVQNSGKILGYGENGPIKNEQDLIKYDGLGNYQDYNNVQNSYKIIWENISKNSESPYWVITSVKCFNKNGQEFYNIY
ncbi:hypothetical protein [Spiroplasma floricola]|uniref:Lipoprotein n=1 Tax=Spiroplasma floricola 23-6 TaxID=1336749 RepID=A0A2K8SCK9_9MOLU|nr:hypothetical protein [Spiroplasma floricola]AUB31182.1 hypothetical protein SFLOR_v1c01210 [Spiroplasma floricola 23-6]